MEHNEAKIVREVMRQLTPFRLVYYLVADLDRTNVGFVRGLAGTVATTMLKPIRRLFALRLGDEAAVG